MEPFSAHVHPSWLGSEADWSAAWEGLHNQRKGGIERTWACDHQRAADETESEKRIDNQRLDPDLENCTLPKAFENASQLWKSGFKFIFIYLASVLALAVYSFISCRITFFEGIYRTNSYLFKTFHYYIYKSKSCVLKWNNNKSLSFFSNCGILFACRG